MKLLKALPDMFYKANTGLGTLMFFRGENKNSVDVLCEVPIASNVYQVAPPSKIYSEDCLDNNLSLESAITEARNVLFELSILSAREATELPFNI